LIIVFLGFIGISIPYLIFPPLFLNSEYSFLPASWDESSRALFLGITLAAYPLGQFIGSPILGTLSDDYGRKHLLSGSLVVSAICNLFTGIAIASQHLALLIVSRLVAGLMEGNVAIARAMCADLKMLSKHETFGKMNATISIAYLVGPLLGAAMTDKNLFEGLTTSTPFFFICILFFFLAGLSALTLKNSVIAATAKTQTLWERFNFIKKISVLFSNKHLKTLMIASTCFTLAIDIFYEFGPVYLTVKWTLGPAQLILYNGILCLGLIVGNGWLSIFTSSRVSNLLLIIGSMAGFALLLTGIIFTNSSLLMLVWLGSCGLLIGLAVTLLTVKISNSASDRVQGEVMGTQLSLRVLGDAIICLLGGVLLILSSKIILIVAAGISLATGIYYKTRQS
jgi:MFS family permease